MHLGSCLCGSVTFEVQGDFQYFFLCHCGRCRKDTGSAHAANLFAAEATLRWTSGEEKVTCFKLPSTRHGRCFCLVCGSALPCVQMDGALLMVPAGSLDGDIDVEADAHIFMSSRATWDEGLQDVPAIDGPPA
jgi:hypothetical protein